MKRYIIEFDKDNESSYTPRTLYVPCAEPIQLLFTVKGETGNQTAGSITLRDVTGTESKTEDEDTVTFTVPQSTNTYSVSSFTFKNGITYDTEINGSIGLNGGVSLEFSNVIVKPVPPESISYVDVGGGGSSGGDIECDSLTATDIGSGTTITPTSISMINNDGTNINLNTVSGEILVGNTTVSDSSINISKGASGAADITFDSVSGDISINSGATGSSMNASGVTTPSLTCDSFMLGATELTEEQLVQLLELL